MLVPQSQLLGETSIGWHFSPIVYSFCCSKSLAASVLAHKLNTGLQCARVPCVCPGAPPSGNRSNRSGFSILLIQYYFHREKLSLKESSSKKITKSLNLVSKRKKISSAPFFAPFKDLIFNRRKRCHLGTMRIISGTTNNKFQKPIRNIKIIDKNQSKLQYYLKTKYVSSRKNLPENNKKKRSLFLNFQIYF